MMRRKKGNINEYTLKKKVFKKYINIKVLNVVKNGLVRRKSGKTSS